jgi:hypothetical protein
MNSAKAPRMPKFVVRVCGVEVSNVDVRLVIGCGESPVRYELVFQDPILGTLPLDDTLPIELWKFKGPIGRQRWEPTDVRRLYSEMILSGTIAVVGASEDEKRAC